MWIKLWGLLGGVNIFCMWKGQEVLRGQGVDCSEFNIIHSKLVSI